jgi:hypothetical protein
MKKDRSDYRKYAVDEFTDDFLKNFKLFLVNMEKLGINDLSFPDWFELFGAWLEVGTDMEELSYK